MQKRLTALLLALFASVVFLGHTISTTDYYASVLSLNKDEAEDGGDEVEVEEPEQEDADFHDSADDDDDDDSDVADDDDDDDDDSDVADDDDDDSDVADDDDDDDAADADMTDEEKAERDAILDAFEQQKDDCKKTYFTALADFQMEKDAVVAEMKTVSESDELTEEEKQTQLDALEAEKEALEADKDSAEETKDSCIDDAEAEKDAALDALGLSDDDSADADTDTDTDVQTDVEEPPAGFEDEVLTAYTENPFLDTDLDDLEGLAAAELYRRGVIGGFADGEFKGDLDVNRAETSKFLLLARYGEVAEFENDGTFSDVLNGEWYTKYVMTSSVLGIIDGYDDGTFRPGDTVNTAEFLKMLTLTFELETDLAYTYTDVEVGSWYEPYVGTAEFYDLFPERANELEPAEELTRGEVAVAIYQYLLNR